MNPNAPAPWVMFLVMCVAVSGFIGLLYLISSIKRLLAGGPPPRAGRSLPVQKAFKRSHAHIARSPHLNAENTRVQRSAFSVQRSADDADLPASRDELQRLAEAIRLRALGEATSKQAALERAFGVSKGAGEGWRRASALWEAAQPQQPAPAPPHDADRKATVTA